MNKRRAKIVGSGGSVSIKDWTRLVRRYNGKCAYCGEPGTTQDHIVPISRGGRHTIGNLLPACKLCNSRKRAKFLIEFRLEAGIDLSRAVVSTG